MKIFIELPTWLGDTIMATPAIENILKKYPNAKITLFGSFISTEALKNHKNIEKVIQDKTRKKPFRIFHLIKEAKNMEKFDMAFSFRSSFTSKILLFFLKSDKKFQYDKKAFKGHQVEKYNSFINKSLNTNFPPQKLTLPIPKKNSQKPLLGINPGATYGSAKRWYPEEFAKVAIALSKKYDILIFGGPAETNIAKDIEEELKKAGVKNYLNLAGKTTITELIAHISSLSLFITNDSGPMHIASAYQIPTIAIFGPTKSDETSPWMNKKAFIIKKDLPCAPCMKRVCPIKTHECMKSIKSEDVLKLIEKINLI
ncbi:MAG: lipopolysaccharide heptosyltransferase II [Epsilonproteobacteria bacterium]|nr:lipopolysaccharide heptosyltransferase II [Campylobacterota bacterium]